MKYAITATLISISLMLTACVSDPNFERSMPVGAKAHGYQVVNSPHPVRYGKFSERFEVQPGDCSATADGQWDDCARSRERAELFSNNTRHREGDISWYRWSIFVPQSHQTIFPAYNTFGQFKHRSKKGTQCGFGILYSFTEANGDLVLAYRKQIDDVKYGSISDKKPSGDTKVSDFATDLLVPSGELTGQWHDIVVNIHWSQDNDGKLRIWIGGNQVIELTGPTMRKGCSNAYFKYGIYRTWLQKSTSASYTPTIIYFDGVRISDNDNGMFDELEE